MLNHGDAATAVWTAFSVASIHAFADRKLLFQFNCRKDSKPGQCFSFDFKRQ
jgi:hypothetical protein